MLRRLGQSDYHVQPIGMGCWPIAGMTSLDVIESESLATLEAAVKCGIDFFDTAFCYGVDGISERLVGQVARQYRDQMVIATKAGVHWDAALNRVNDASPDRLRFEVDQSLERLGLDFVDLLYLHSPDEKTPMRVVASTLADIQKSGRARAIGVSNVSLGQLREFHQVCPVAAAQLRYNMLQREIETEIVPWCLENKVAIVAYWPLVKGLLAGKIRRDHKFDPSDKRLTYPMFRGAEWERNQCLLDDLEQIAAGAKVSLVSLVLGWTVSQPGITVAICGAKRPWQIVEAAAALDWRPDPIVLDQIDAAISRRNQTK